MKLLKVIRNILWILLGGLWLAILWGIVGVLLCLTIVGVPFGVQCFKLAKLSFLPTAEKSPDNICYRVFLKMYYYFLLKGEK